MPRLAPVTKAMVPRVTNDMMGAPFRVATRPDRPVGLVATGLRVDRSVWYCQQVVRTRPAAAPLAADLPVRERIMATASPPLLRRGIQAVGIQRIIDEAGIAKASLYAHFASKDDLVAAYLAEKGKAVRTTLGAHLDNPRLGPKAKILKFFDMAVDAAAVRGSAAARSRTRAPKSRIPDTRFASPPASSARGCATSSRTWRARSPASAPAGDRLAGALMVLYDGAAASGAIDGDAAAARHARWAAEKMLGSRRRLRPGVSIGCGSARRGATRSRSSTRRRRAPPPTHASPWRARPRRAARRR